ncbi:hypothetical protein ABID56_000614 [Alkalibacillus flavidus]|uniref:LysM domain-containing protein n=1 Tax=Alkalibacillus flavidus TaxID=546021 RepID=A0ABV2KSH9_9BACI
MKIHIVKQGESMATIADKYRLSEKELYEMNKHLSETTDVIEGMKVKVPYNVTVQNRHHDTNENNKSNDERFPLPNQSHAPKPLAVIREDEWFDKQLLPYTPYQSVAEYQSPQPFTMPYPYPHFYEVPQHTRPGTNSCGY